MEYPYSGLYLFVISTKRSNKRKKLRPLSDGTWPPGTPRGRVTGAEWVQGSVDPGVRAVGPLGRRKPASADVGRHGSAAPTGSQTWRKTIPDASQTTTERHHAAAGAEMLCILHVVTRGRGVTPDQFFGKIGYFGLRRQAPPRCLGWLGPPMDVFWWWVVSVWARGALCGVYSSKNMWDTINGI